MKRKIKKKIFFQKKILFITEKRTFLVFIWKKKQANKFVQIEKY